MTPKAGQEGSIFSVGGIKSNLYTGDMRWHSLFVTDKTPEYWTVKLTDVLVDGKSMGLCKPYGCPFAVDTGTSLITGPSHMINKVSGKGGPSLGQEWLGVSQTRTGSAARVGVPHERLIID